MPAAYSDEELISVLEKTPAFVAVVRGPTYVYEFVNERYASVVAIEDPVGKAFGESHHPAVTALRQALDRVYATGEAWTDAELRLDLRGADGALATWWFEVHFVPLRRGERVDGVLIHSYDVTALVRARREAIEHAALREKMEQVQKLESLGVLAGGIAHDFNNMLAIVLTSVSAAAARLPPDSPAQPLLEAAVDGARRASSLTRQLLTYAGKSHAATRAIDLSVHVRDVARLVAAALPYTVKLDVAVDPDLAPVQADPAQTQQIVMNLVINAGEALGDRPGQVVVTTGVEHVDDEAAGSVVGGDAMGRGDHAFVDVRDDGPGIDAATLPRIFDPFFSTKASGPSARGLGLAAVLGIVRAHRGGIRVRSTKGVGTTFRVLLPLATRTVHPPAPGTSTPRATP
ncbi:MAG TPA: ATP-binding protein [Polyangiaceae bacterium]|jgi:signal transduction histidine kinase